jgi:transcriptional regulator with XRE-family HTH domain
MGATKSVGEAFRQARMEAGLSILELSERSGISDATLYRIELGQHPRPRMSTVRAVATALGLKPTDLLPEVAA